MRNYFLLIFATGCRSQWWTSTTSTTTWWSSTTMAPPLCESKPMASTASLSGTSGMIALLNYERYQSIEWTIRADCSKIRIYSDFVKINSYAQGLKSEILVKKQKYRRFPIGNPGEKNFGFQTLVTLPWIYRQSITKIFTPHLFLGYKFAIRLILLSLRIAPRFSFTEAGESKSERTAGLSSIGNVWNRCHPELTTQLCPLASVTTVAFFEKVASRTALKSGFGKGMSSCAQD